MGFVYLLESVLHCRSIDVVKTCLVGLLSAQKTGIENTISQSNSKQSSTPRGVSNRAKVVSKISGSFVDFNISIGSHRISRIILILKDLQIS